MNDTAPVRRATTDDAAEVARLLHDFNLEFDTPTPGPEVLAGRLRELLDGQGDPGATSADSISAGTVAYLSGDPAVGVAVLTFRRNVWYPGPVALLDELYVAPAHRDRGLGSALVARLLADAVQAGVSAIEINVDEADTDAQRFYERHGFSATEPGSTERALYYFREF